MSSFVGYSFFLIFIFEWIVYSQPSVYLPSIAFAPFFIQEHAMNISAMYILFICLSPVFTGSNPTSTQEHVSAML